jgi:hypothetical protein
MSIIDSIKRNNERLALKEKHENEETQLIQKQDSDIRKTFLNESKEFLELLKLNNIAYRVQEYMAPYVNIKIEVCGGMWIDIEMRTNKQPKKYGIDYRSSYTCKSTFEYFDTFEEMILNGLTRASRDKEHFVNNFDKLYTI